MNPLLLKPEADTHSQVVLMGQVAPNSRPCTPARPQVWPQIAVLQPRAARRERRGGDRGRRSPAEINLHASDIVNMYSRHAPDARSLLDRHRPGRRVPVCTAPGRYCPMTSALDHGLCAQISFAAMRRFAGARARSW